MNERIKEFAKLAGFNHYNYEGGNAELFNRFAQLIIKECIDILNPEGDLTSMREEYGRKLSMNMIKEHFGIE